MSRLEKIIELYTQIPSTVCRDGCFACCFDMIQMSPEEMEYMGGYEYTGKCIHLVDGHCSVYEKRPLVCRLYGASELLYCKDCEASGILSAEKTRLLVEKYTALLKSKIE